MNRRQLLAAVAAIPLGAIAKIDPRAEARSAAAYILAAGERCCPTKWYSHADRSCYRIDRATGELFRQLTDGQWIRLAGPDGRPLREARP